MLLKCPITSGVINFGREPRKFERSESVTGMLVESEGIGDVVGGGGVRDSGDVQRDGGAGEVRAIVISPPTS